MNEHEEIAKGLKKRLSELRTHLAKVDPRIAGTPASRFREVGHGTFSCAAYERTILFRAKGGTSVHASHFWAPVVIGILVVSLTYFATKA
jgi:hypothetical protein